MGIHTTGVRTGTESCTMTGWVGTIVTGTAGTMNAVLTGIGDDWATTVVMWRQWQVGRRKTSSVVAHVNASRRSLEGVEGRDGAMQSRSCLG